MAKKGAFVDGLDDIDDLMPPPIPRPEAADPQPADPPPAAAAQAAAPAVQAPPAATAAQSAPAARPAPRRRRAAVSVPTAEVAPNIHRLLHRLTTKEKTRDRITARTYAQVVMDALEAHQDELSTHWTQPMEAPGGGGGLFSRRPAAPARRRRHAEPPARIPLTGLNPDDAAVLERLVEAWNAPSRSALVEQALRLYLNAD